MARMSVTERRQRLIDAAITAMLRDGVPDTSTRSIVAEAGMQIGVFHYCFRSKDELIVEVARTINQRAFSEIGDILSTSSSAEEAIRKGTTAYWNHVRANREERLLLFELTQSALRHEEQGAAALEQYHTYLHGMSGFLAAAAALENRRWRSGSDHMARYILAVLQGASLQWLVTSEEPETTAVLDHMVQTVVADLEPSDPGASASAADG